MLLSYRFDTVDQLVRHLHLDGDSTLMFAPGPARPLQDGLLQLQVAQTGAQATVRAQVVARALGSLPGAWMRFDSRLCQHLRTHGSLEARHHHRSFAEQVMVVLSGGRASRVVQLLDVGTGGLRVRGGLEAGDWYEVRLVGARRTEGELGVAEVMRVEGSESGLRFVEPQTEALDHAIGELEKLWAGAGRIEHAKACCVGGRPIEPAAPRRRPAFN